MNKPSVSICHLSRYKETSVSLKGWVYNLRSSGKICFLVLRDGSDLCQCVLNKVFTPEESFNVFKNLQKEHCIEVFGKVKEWKNNFEIQVESLKILHRFKTPFPLGNKEHGIDFLLKNRHLWLRSKKPWSILKIRNEITKALHLFLQKNGFIQIEAPILSPHASESSSTLFPVHFFNEEKMYLSQSGQFYMEAATAAFGKVYCFNPVFRSEKSSTRRHLLEFWMVEPEMAFCDLKQCMQIAEDLIVFILSHVLNTSIRELEVLNRSIQLLEKIKAPFPKLSYEETVKILQKKKPGGFKKGKELGGEDETIISQLFQSPVFIHHYPTETKAFYMKTDTKDPQFSLSFDLLGTQGYGELIGGSQREDDENLLKHKMKSWNIEEKPLNWYLDLRKYGSFPHSGFGLGIERAVSWICGLDHVRGAHPFPRLYGRSFF